MICYLNSMGSLKIAAHCTAVWFSASQTSAPVLPEGAVSDTL